MKDLFLSVLEISLSTSVIILVMLALSPLLSQRYAAKWKYGIWILLALRLAIPVTIHLPQQRIQLDVPAQLAAPIVTAAPALPQAGNVLVPAAKAALTPLDVLGMIWLIGCAACLLVHLVFYRVYRRRILVNGTRVTDAAILQQIRSIARELGVRQGLRVIRDPSAGSPMVLGFLRPILVLPETSYPAQALYFVLKHELIHLNRHDLWSKFLFVTANAVHWFNPIVYLMQKEAVVDMELSCDERVIQGTVLDARKAYTETLLATLCRQYRKTTALSTQFYGGKVIMKKRFKNILHRVKKRNGLAILVMAVTAALVLGMVTGCSVATASSGTASNTASDQQQILDLSMAFGKAFNEKDTDAMAALMVPEYQGSLSTVGPEGLISFTGCISAPQVDDVAVEEGVSVPVGSTTTVQTGDLSIPEGQEREWLILTLKKTEDGWKVAKYCYDREWTLSDGQVDATPIESDPSPDPLNISEDMEALDDTVSDFAFNYFWGDRENLDRTLIQPYPFTKEIFADFYHDTITGYTSSMWPEFDSTFQVGDVVPVSLRFTDPEYSDSFTYLTIELIKTAEGWKVQFYGLEK